MDDKETILSRACCCHSEPLAYHSERSEESRSQAQDMLREKFSPYLPLSTSSLAIRASFTSCQYGGAYP